MFPVLTADGNFIHFSPKNLSGRLQSHQLRKRIAQLFQNVNFFSFF